MKNIKLLSLGIATLGLLVGVAAIGPNKVSAFVEKIFSERGKVIQEMERLDAQGKGTILDQDEGYTVKRFQLRNSGKEGVLYKATGEAKGEYHYKDPEGRWEIKAGPSVNSELGEIENREGVKHYEVRR